MDEHRNPGGSGAGKSLTNDAVPRLPRRARRRLEAAADTWNRTQHPGTERNPESAAPPPDRAGLLTPWPWAVAAAFAVLAVAGWWPRLAPTGDAVERGREQLIASAGPALGRWPWAHESGLVATVQGEVVWDGRRQQGYLTLSGLPPNTRGERQYQLWIFDSGRDDRYPVDGGIFDVPAGSAVVTVPIRPALRVSLPVAFAVTLEPAGGVVVSDRTHLVAMARATPP